MKFINMHNYRSGIKKQWIIVLIVLSIYVSNTASAVDYNYFLISAEPQSYLTPTKPFPVYLYAIDTSGKHFKQVADLGHDSLGVWFVNTYPNERLFSIGYGTTGLYSIRIYNLENIKENQYLELSETGTIVANHLIFDSTGELSLDVKSINAKSRKLEGRTYKILAEKLSLSGNSRINSLLLAGPTPSLSSGYADLEKATIDRNGIISLQNEEYSHLVSLPKLDMVLGNYENRWNIIANEKEYVALSEVTRSLEYKLLLTYSRIDQKWHKYHIEGDTRIHTIGNWLTGQWMMYNPKSSFEKGQLYPPIPTTKVYLIHPAIGTVYVFDPGLDSEILWVEENDILYRVGHELYSARIEGGNIVDKNLLVSDPMIMHIHWAFPLSIN